MYSKANAFKQTILLCACEMLTIDQKKIQTEMADNEEQYTLGKYTLNFKIVTFCFVMYFEAWAP